MSYPESQKESSLRLQHVATVNVGELYEVEVLVNGEPHKYRVHSVAVEKFDKLYKSKWTHGKALHCLKDSDQNEPGNGPVLSECGVVEPAPVGGDRSGDLFNS